MGRIILIHLAVSLCAYASTSVQPFFNRTEAGSYTDPYRLHSRSGQNIEEQVIDLIEQANRRIWIAAYELRLPLVAKALREAQSRGVDVRLVTENNNNYDFRKLESLITEASDFEIGRLRDYFAYADLNNNATLEDSELLEMDAMRILMEAKIPVVDDTEDGSKGSGLMHHKFIVIDSKYVFSGSGNFTWSDFHGDKLKPSTLGNANNFFLFESQIINKAFADEFLVLWGDGPSGLKNSRFGVKKPYRAPLTTQLRDNSRVTLQFGATSKTYGWDSSPNGFIGKHLSQMEVSLEAAFFVWSEQKHTDLIPQHLASNVQVLIDPFFGYRSYSELLDLLGVQMLSEHCKIEPENKPWSEAALNSGVTYLSSGDMLHHKFAIIDSKKVITGSHNWSANANENNDEVLVLFESTKIASEYKREFDRLKSHSALGVTPKLEYKIKAAQDNCVYKNP